MTTIQECSNGSRENKMSMNQTQGTQQVLHEQPRQPTAEQKLLCIAESQKPSQGGIPNTEVVNNTIVNGAHVMDPNGKKKTPMCLINELARHHKLQPQYRLTEETGPPHQKQFTVTLKLGEEEYAASGPSIKKAQHATAQIALKNTSYPKPPPKPKPKIQSGNQNVQWITPTVELNAYAMKLGLPTNYTSCPLVSDHTESIAPNLQNRPSNPPLRDFRDFENGKVQGHYFSSALQPRPAAFAPRLPRLHARAQYPRYPAYPGIHRIILTVGDIQVTGEGPTAQAARHNAASLALEQLRTRKPIPAGETNATEQGPVAVSNQDTDSGNKSPVSLVHELALKLNQIVEFSVINESGPPHMKMFTIRCTLGQFSTEGEGNCKKLAKKQSAEMLLAELKRAYPNGIQGNVESSVAAASRLRSKTKTTTNRKKTRNLVKEVAAPSAVSDDSSISSCTPQDPISRLTQRQQARKEKQPTFEVISERGIPRQPEFIVQVTVGDLVAQGIGPKKKDAKRAAALKALELLNTSQSSANETNAATSDIIDKDAVTPGRQNIPGLLVVSPAGLKLKAEDSNIEQNTENAAAAEPVPAAKTQPKGSISGVRPKTKLLYLAQVQGFEVEFTDFPKGTKGEFLSLVMLSSDPSSVCHGTGTTIEEAHDDVSSKVLQRLAETGLDSIGRKK